MRKRISKLRSLVMVGEVGKDGACSSTARLDSRLLGGSGRGFEYTDVTTQIPHHGMPSRDLFLVDQLQDLTCSPCQAIAELFDFRSSRPAKTHNHRETPNMQDHTYYRLDL